MATSLATTPHCRAQLAALFWPDHADERARSNLRVLLHNLTSLLPGCLKIDRQTVQLLGASACWTDTAAFEALLSENTLASLAAAAELYRSSFLDGLYLDECPDVETWLAQQREHWHERVAHVLSEVIAHAREREEWVAGLRSVDRLLELDPWREAAHQDKMRLLALSGQRDSALAQFEICRRVLVDELGIDPSSETLTLYEQIRDGVLAPVAPSLIATPSPRRFDVPLLPTPLLGRADERTWLMEHLTNPAYRCITLVGTGGIGKTYLALDIAAAIRDAFAEISFVDLTRVSDATHVASGIARTLGVREADDQPLLDSIKQHVNIRQMLLLLDNFEHVIAAAPLVADLLSACPHLKVLATSRQELHLRGEHVVPISPLALPDAHARPDPARLAEVAAVALFVERARQHQPAFVLTAENAVAVAEICRRLDGLPLAIELAAARIGLFPPAMLVQRLSNRLHVLTRGPHDLPTRQQTLQNTLDWSYNLLEPSEQTLFAHLAVFAGGWTIAAVEEVCALPARPDYNVLDALQGLLDKYLISQELRTDGEPRFTMLETIRDYARSRLTQHDDADAIRQRHAAYYLASAERAIPEAEEHTDSEHLAQIEREYDNHLAALQWMLEQHASENSLRLCNALANLWDKRGLMSEGLYWLRAVLALPNAEPSVARADALGIVGRFSVELGDWSTGIDLLSQALRLSRALGDTRRIALLLRSQGWLALMRGAYTEATLLLEESSSLYRELGDNYGISRVLGLQGQVAYEQGAFTQAVPLLTETIAISRALDDKIDLGWAINKLGLVALYQGRLAEADRLLVESLALFTQLDYQRGIAWVLGCIGWVQFGEGNNARAAELLEDSLARYQTLGEKRNIAFCLERLASLAVVQGRMVRAARLFGAASTLRQTRAVLLPPADHAQYAPFLAQLHAALDADSMTAAWADGAALSIEQAIAYALQPDEMRGELLTASHSYHCTP